MLSLRVLAATLALASTNVFAQCISPLLLLSVLTPLVVNPITRPTVGDILVAGTTFDILVYTS